MSLTDSIAPFPSTATISIVCRAAVWFVVVVRGTWYVVRGLQERPFRLIHAERRRRMMMNSKLATGGIGSIHFALPVRDWPRWPRCIM